MTAISTVTAIDPVQEGPDRPLVSVVTATFNARDNLAATLASVAGQGFRDVEHVVVDGGSRDGTVALLEHQPEVRWISEKDAGIADAMNKGVQLARGQWIIVLHAGDVFFGDDALAMAVNRLSEDIDILTCAIRIGGTRPDVEHYHADPKGRLSFKALLHQATLCRRALFEQIGGFDTSFRIGMDYEFFLRARSQGARFAAVPLVIARMDDAGVSSRRDWPSLAGRFQEEKRAQSLYAADPLARMMYGLYWPPYLLYRRLRSLLDRP